MNMHLYDLSTEYERDRPVLFLCCFDTDNMTDEISVNIKGTSSWDYNSYFWGIANFQIDSEDAVFLLPNKLMFGRGGYVVQEL